MKYNHNSTIKGISTYLPYNPILVFAHRSGSTPPNMLYVPITPVWHLKHSGRSCRHQLRPSTRTRNTRQTPNASKLILWAVDERGASGRRGGSEWVVFAEDWTVLFCSRPLSNTFAVFIPASYVWCKVSFSLIATRGFFHYKVLTWEINLRGWCILITLWK